MCALWLRPVSGFQLYGGALYLTGSRATMTIYANTIFGGIGSNEGNQAESVRFFLGRTGFQVNPAGFPDNVLSFG